MKFLQILVMAGVVAMATGSSLAADSPAEMLEKAIYNEDTVGNLEEAIKIYRQVVTEAGKTQTLAATAQFRLAQCLLKQGKKAEATAAFKAVVANYPNQKDIVAKAKQQIGEEVLFQSTPWKDGERLTLQMSLPGGQVIGLVGLAVNKSKLDGTDVWEMTIRRFVEEGQNEGVSKVWVKPSGFRPLRTVFDHTIFGKTEATWSDDRIAMTRQQPGKEAEKSEVTFEDVAYSNDQVFYGFRQLPLRVGYQVTLPIRVAFTGGNPIGLEVDVTKKEKVETPAGTFDCFRLETNIQQTFWVADAPERYVVKFEAQGVTAQLTSITHDATEREYSDDEHGFSVTVPKGWFYIAREMPDVKNATSVQLIAPEMASARIFVKDKSLLDSDESESAQAWMQKKIERLERTFEHFDRTLEDAQRIRFGNFEGVAISTDRTVGHQEFVFELSLGLHGDKSVQMVTNAAKNEAETAKATFDAIQESFKLR